MRWYTENEIASLLEDPVARAEVGKAFLRFSRTINGFAAQEGIWGPAHELESQVRKSLEAHERRISDEKRNKK